MELKLEETQNMATMKNHGSPKKISFLSFLKYEHLVAGISGGVTSTLILHPLDLIKIRFAGESFFPFNEITNDTGDKYPLQEPITK